MRGGGVGLCSSDARLEQSAACLALSRCACATRRVRFLVGSAETLCTVFLALPIIAIVRTFSRGLGGALTRAAEVHISAVHLLDSLCVGSRLGSARGVALQRFNESGLCTLMVFHHRVRLLWSLAWTVHREVCRPGGSAVHRQTHITEPKP